ncbi:MAG TPA: ROK family transcriptional regulator [Phyllobacterium sp.]|nr:ROK family transcriptional regulator [Phyllobacterium sp.]
MHIHNGSWPSAVTLTVLEHSVLRYIRQHPGESRTEIAAALGISKSMLTKAVTRFQTVGVVNEVRTALADGERGQPPVKLTLNGKAFYSVGLYINTNQIAVVLTDLSGGIQRVWEHDTVSHRLTIAETVLQDVAEALETSTAPVLGIGMAVPAIVNEWGELFEVTPTQRDLPLREIASRIQSEFSLPVYWDNGAYCIANYEYNRPHSESRCLFYLSLDFGIGGGLVWNNQLFRGAFNQAGNIGALMPETGSRPNLADLSRTLRRPLESLGMVDIMALMEEKNPELLAWICERGTGLSAPLATVVQLFNPDTIVLGGSFPDVVLNGLIEQIDLDLLDTIHRRPLTKPVIRTTELLGSRGLAEAAALIPISARLLGQEAMAIADR